LAKEKPPIFGMLQRTGEVVIRMLILLANSLGASEAAG
jgi:hypothetical protein